MGLWVSTVYRCGYLYRQMWVELAWFDTVFRCCLLTGKSWESSHSRKADREDRPSSCLSHSPPLAKQPLFCSNTWYMQIKARCEEHEVTANDKPKRGVWHVGCLNRHLCRYRGTPKTEGDIPWTLPARAGDLSWGRNKATGAASRARSTVGSGDLQLYKPVEAATSPSDTKLLWLLCRPECSVPIPFV